MYESLIMQDGQGEMDLSEQFMLQCTDGSSCAGGYGSDAVQVAFDHGMPTETAYPYKANDAYFAENPGICSGNSNVYHSFLTNTTVPTINWYYSTTTPKSDQYLKDLLM